MARLSVTEIAFLMVALQQLLFAVGWAVGAGLMPAVRRAAASWAVHAAAGAVGIALFAIGARDADHHGRWLGNLAVVLSLAALHAGVRGFFGRPSVWRWHAAALGAVVLATLLAAGRPGGPVEGDSALRIGVVSAVLMGLSLATAADIARCVRQDHAGQHWALLFALPPLLGALLFGARTLRTLITPDTVAYEIAADAAPRVGAAFAYLAVMTVFQLMLFGLVVARLVTDLRRVSRRDALTGLLNRRAIQDALDRELRRVERGAPPFSVLMVDVDHFKRVNDVHGHATGDRVLQHLATLMRSQMRATDLAARWGGEEFLVLLPTTDVDAACVIAERLRDAVARQPVVLQPEAPAAGLPLSLSAGVAQWRGDGDDLVALLARADAALYRAKAGGRNRVIVEDPGPAAGSGAPFSVGA